MALRRVKLVLSYKVQVTVNSAVAYEDDQMSLSMSDAMTDLLRAIGHQPGIDPESLRFRVEPID